MTDDRRALRLVIEGRVQGVGFRAWMVDVANAAGVDGWVRNRRDGTVEALVAGAPAAVERVLAETRAGPPLSRVTAVREEPADDRVGPGFDAVATV
ncbi:MAG: acylphosphatase [Alphaproteobacteria bacterium]|jgi:acylphosphatase|nr:acylphosphatase [Alphaproteobacteria bacterium]